MLGSVEPVSRCPIGKGRGELTNEDAETPGSDHEIGVHQGALQMVHNVRDLNGHR